MIEIRLVNYLKNVKTVLRKKKIRNLECKATDNTDITLEFAALATVQYESSWFSDNNNNTNNNSLCCLTWHFKSLYY